MPQFDCLLNKKIIAILDGDEKYDSCEIVNVNEKLSHGDHE